MSRALGSLTTEAANPASARIDELDAAGIVQVMNAEDAAVAEAVARESAAIARSIDVIADRFRAGGRLVYIGAGTSGRLGVLDASECPPTFGTPPEMVVGLIAGGRDALTRAIEGAEDSLTLAAADLSAIGLSSSDVLVGIATSGRTPYVLGGLTHARAVGAFTIGFACNANSELEALADEMIVPHVGPEIVAGSTRLKAGTATKMVLNMLTTGAMIRIGRVGYPCAQGVVATVERRSPAPHAPRRRARLMTSRSCPGTPVAWPTRSARTPAGSFRGRLPRCSRKKA